VKHRIDTPEETYGALFTAVQSVRTFPDSKTFVDAVPRSAPERILAAFHRARFEPGFDLRRFVEMNFELPRQPPGDHGTGSRRPLLERVDALWDELLRGADALRPHSSLVPLPRPYVVPGGRFSEVYYWDSYFTMLGLAASGRVALVEDMVANFAYLIDLVGFVPNGNRSYYCTRSQPPLFVLMVELLAEARRDPQVVGNYLPQLDREYSFWMSEAKEDMDDGTAARRVVAIDGGFLNRYWDDADTPRPESYFEDVELVHVSGRDPSGLLRDVRAACESGWDFSSRWTSGGRSLASLRTTTVLPVDLNSILFRLETVLAREFHRVGLDVRASQLEQRARHRLQAIRTRFFDERTGFFTDLLLPDLTPSPAQSLAGAFPLFVGAATPEQARAVAARIHGSFLRPGGWVTTLDHSGQQWDAPNGWAPLHWVSYAGMCRYGCIDHATTGASRWVDNVRRVYDARGVLLEKYDVEEIGRPAGGGEYEVQTGFGWTNGVLVRMLQELGR